MLAQNSLATMLNNSQPVPTIDRRQTAQAARNTLGQQKKQSFAEAVKEKFDVQGREKGMARLN